MVNSILVFSLAPLLVVSSDRPAGEREHVDQAVGEYLEDKPDVAVVVGIAGQGGRQVLGYGNVTLNGDRVTPDGKTLFEIGSITKVFTGTLVADLVIEEKMMLTDPASKHLPPELCPPAFDGEPISIVELATHRSGLPRIPPLFGFFMFATGTVSNPYSKYGPGDLGRNLSQLKLRRPIGSKFEYSNIGVGLLGHAVVHTSGAASYEELVRKQICEPLGMSDTCISVSDALSERMPPGHGANGKPTPYWDFAALEGAGALRSTVDDMLTFAEANLGLVDSRLKPAFELAMQPRADADRDGMRIGLCWLARHAPGGKQVRLHNGRTGGFSGFLAIVPEEKTAVVILANSAAGVDATAMKILNGVLAE